MSSVNKMIIVGNLGRDPQKKQMGNGDSVVSIAVATTKTWKNKDGQKQEKTEWHNCVAFRQLADIMDKYLKKGSQVYLEGYKQTDKYQADDGSDRYSCKIIVDQMQMLGGNGGTGSAPKQNSEPKYANQSGLNANQPDPKNSKSEPNFEFDDDIPF
jgi:single-strand DNA-binding protein